MPRGKKRDNNTDNVQAPTRAQTFPRRVRATKTAEEVTATKCTRSRSGSNLQTSQIIPDDDDVVVISPPDYAPVYPSTGTSRRKNSTGNSSRGGTGRGGRRVSTANFNMQPLLHQNQSQLSYPHSDINANRQLTNVHSSNPSTNDFHSEFNWNITDEVLQQFPVVAHADYSDVDLREFAPTPSVSNPNYLESSITTVTQVDVDSESYHIPNILTLESHSHNHIQLKESNPYIASLTDEQICQSQGLIMVDDLNSSFENQNGNDSENYNLSSSFSSAKFRKPSVSSPDETSDLYKHLTVTYVTPASLLKDGNEKSDGEGEENEKETKLPFSSSDTNESSTAKNKSTLEDHDSDDLDSFTVFHDTSFHKEIHHAQLRNCSRSSNSDVLLNDTQTASIIPSYDDPHQTTENIEENDECSSKNNGLLKMLTPDLPKFSMPMSTNSTLNLSNGNQNAKSENSYINHPNPTVQNCGYPDPELESLEKEKLGTVLQASRDTTRNSNSNTSIPVLVAITDSEFSDGESVNILTIPESDSSFHKNISANNLNMDIDVKRSFTSEHIRPYSSESKLSQCQHARKMNKDEVVTTPKQSSNLFLQIVEKNHGSLGGKSCSDTDTASETERVEKANGLFEPPGNKHSNAGEGKVDTVPNNLQKPSEMLQNMPEYALAIANKDVDTNFQDGENNKETEPAILEPAKKVATRRVSKPKSKIKPYKDFTVEDDTVVISDASLSKFNKNKPSSSKILNSKGTSKTTKDKDKINIKKVKTRGRPRTIAESEEVCLPTLDSEISTNTNNVNKNKDRPRSYSNPSSDLTPGPNQENSENDPNGHGKKQELNNTVKVPTFLNSRSKEKDTKTGKGKPRMVADPTKSVPNLQLVEETSVPLPLPMEVEEELPDIPATELTEAFKFTAKETIPSVGRKSVDGKGKKKISHQPHEQRSTSKPALATPAVAPPKRLTKIVGTKANATLKQVSQQKPKLKPVRKSADNSETVNQDDTSAQANLKTRWIWYYNQEHKNILYKDGAFLALRDDLNKDGNIYLWRIMKDYKMLRKFKPIEIDGRHCHYGVDEFRIYQMDDAFVCKYQPVIFTMVIDNPKFQIGIFYNTVENLQLLAYFPATNNLFNQFNAFLKHMVIRAMTDDEQIKPEKNTHGGATQSAVEVIEAHLGRILQEIMFRQHWPRETMMCLLEYPSINKTRTKVNRTLNCVSCSKLGKVTVSAFKLLFHGECYDASTLVLTHKEGPTVPGDIQFCHGCPIILRSLHRLIHYKYWVFVAIRMQLQQLYKTLQTGQSFQAKEVFDFIVGDFEWVNKMFYEFQATLGEGTQAVEKTDRQMRQIDKKLKSTVKNEPGESSKKPGRPRLDSNAFSEQTPRNTVSKNIKTYSNPKKVKKNTKRDVLSAESCSMLDPNLPPANDVPLSLEITSMPQIIPKSEQPVKCYAAKSKFSEISTTEPKISAENVCVEGVELQTDAAGEIKKAKLKRDKSNNTPSSKPNNLKETSKNKTDLADMVINSEQAKQIQENFHNAIRRASIPPLQSKPSLESSGSETDEPEPSLSICIMHQSEETATT